VFFDPFGLPPGMATTSSRAPCETSSSKATATLSTRIVPAVALSLLGHSPNTSQPCEVFELTSEPQSSELWSGCSCW